MPTVTDLLLNAGGNPHPVPKNDFDIAIIYPPIITVGQPKIMLPPCAVTSPMRAAGILFIITVDEPITIESGGPVHTHISPILAAGRPPIKTFTLPGGKIGPPTCGTTPLTIGHTCISVILAAKGILIYFYY
jgi:hypothetical protein